MLKSGDRAAQLPDPPFLRDPYQEWVRDEAIPVVDNFGADLLRLETAPWARFGVNGAIIHLKGRGDFISVFVLEIPRGAKTSPQKHLFEQVVFILAGYGSTTIEFADGRKHSFEWGPRSLFALPPNVKYQHFNGSGAESARLSSTNNLCLLMNLFHSESFVFANAHSFEERNGPADYFAGDGRFIPAPRGRQMWETNFVPDVGSVDLLANDKRGAGSSTLAFILADGIMHAHCSSMPVGTYKKAHRHGSDYHITIVDGEGYSLFWYEGDKDLVRVDWRYGSMFAPPDQMYHQHFNTRGAPVRYMATALGNSRYPFTAKNRAGKLGVDVSVKDGGFQIEFEDQDTRIHPMYLEVLAANGVECLMAQPSARRAS